MAEIATTSLTYLGHSTVVLAIDGTRLLTDPILRPRAGPLVRVAAPVDRTAWAAIDAVLISHSHWDHLDFGSLRLLPRNVALVVPRGMGRRLLARGFRHVIELGIGDATQVGAVRIEATHAEHRGWSTSPATRPSSTACGTSHEGSTSP